jgi:hypothetical protein
VPADLSECDTFVSIYILTFHSNFGRQEIVVAVVLVGGVVSVLGNLSRKPQISSERDSVLSFYLCCYLTGTHSFPKLLMQIISRAFGDLISRSGVECREKGTAEAAAALLSSTLGLRPFDSRPSF